MILLIEDEMARAKASEFHLVYPTKTQGRHYSSLLRNPRFTDHLLTRWIELGGISGRALQYLPTEVQAYFPTSSSASRPKKTRPSSASVSISQSRSLSTPSSSSRLSSRPSSAINREPVSNSNNSSLKARFPLPPRSGQRSRSTIVPDNIANKYVLDEEEMMMTNAPPQRLIISTPNQSKTKLSVQTLNNEMASSNNINAGIASASVSSQHPNATTPSERTQYPPRPPTKRPTNGTGTASGDNRPTSASTNPRKVSGGPPKPSSTPNEVPDNGSTSAAEKTLLSIAQELTRMQRTADFPPYKSRTLNHFELVKRFRQDLISDSLQKKNHIPASNPLLAESTSPSISPPNLSSVQSLSSSPLQSPQVSPNHRQLQLQLEEQRLRSRLLHQSMR